MPSSSWNYVDVICNGCEKQGNIRVDQFNRKGKTWTCRSCAYRGRALKVKSPSPKHDPLKAGAWRSYWRAKKRVRENHQGVYEHVSFNFESFEEFYEEIGPRPDGKSLDRIDPWGDYETGNVRWATHKEQCNNRRKSLPNGALPLSCVS